MWKTSRHGSKVYIRGILCCGYVHFTVWFSASASSSPGCSAPLLPSTRPSFDFLPHSARLFRVVLVPVSTSGPLPFLSLLLHFLNESRHRFRHQSLQTWSQKKSARYFHPSPITQECRLKARGNLRKQIRSLGFFQFLLLRLSSWVCDVIQQAFLFRFSAQITYLTDKILQIYKTWFPDRARDESDSWWWVLSLFFFFLWLTTGWIFFHHWKFISG